MALIYPQNGDLTKSLKSARKKVPQSARLSAGGGGAKAKRAMPKFPRVNLSGASLIWVRYHSHRLDIRYQKGAAYRKCSGDSDSHSKT